MASSNEIDRYSLISTMGASEVPRGGARRSTELAFVDIHNNPTTPPSAAFLGMEEAPPESLDDQEVEAEPQAGPPPRKRRVAKAKLAPAVPEVEAPGHQGPIVDLEYGSLLIEGVEVEAVSRGDNGCLMIATKIGAATTFKIEKGEVCWIIVDGKRTSIYSTGLRTQMCGMNISTFIEIEMETEEEIHEA